MRRRHVTLLGLLSLAAVVSTILGGALFGWAHPAPAVLGPAVRTAAQLPRAADGKPSLQGIWQIKDTGAAWDLEGRLTKSGAAGKSVVEGGTIPYMPEALAKRQQNFTNRQKADPMESCFMPGVPRIMYLDYPFQIFQTSEHVAMTFEWSQVFRLVYLQGKAAPSGFDFWMGHSMGRWDGDTFVVDVTAQNDKTWFDKAGNHHSDGVKMVERYKLVDADTLQYEVTVDDACATSAGGCDAPGLSRTYTKPWKIALQFGRRKDINRILEYQCQAEKEEANGLFERDPRTWYTPKAAEPAKKQ